MVIVNHNSITKIRYCSGFKCTFVRLFCALSWASACDILQTL